MIERGLATTKELKSCGIMVFKKQTIVDYTTTDKQKATAAQKTLIAIYEGDNAFDITLVKALESYLDEQLTSSTNDVDANLALLKMYLVYPETTNVQKIAQVLTKCVMLFPSSAFNGASAIIPETFREVGFHLEYHFYSILTF